MRDRATKNHLSNSGVPNLRPRTFSDYAIALGTSVFIFFTCVFFVNQNPATPFDEFSHFDYVDKVSEFHLPKLNELMSQRTLDAAACSGVRGGAAWAALEPCGSLEFNPRNAPWAGQNTATGYLPTYYALTAIPYKILKIGSTSSSDHLRSARLANSIWLALSSMFIFLILRRRSYSLPLSFGLSVAFCAIPSQQSQAVTVNPDAAALFFSIFAVYLSQELTLSLSARKLTAIWGFFTFLSLSIKLTTAPAVLLAAILFAQRFKDDKSKYWIIFRGITLGVIVTGLLQIAQSALRGVAEPSSMGAALQSTPKQLIESMWGSIYYMWLPYAPVGWDVLNNAVAGYFVFFFALATPLLGMYYYGLASNQFKLENRAPNKKKRIQNLGSRYTIIAIFGILIFFGPLQTLTGYLFSGAAFYQPRYFMAASASTLICLLILIERAKGIVFFLYLLSGLSLVSLTLNVLEF
jgi:hypothetical protein